MLLVKQAAMAALLSITSWSAMASSDHKVISTNDIKWGLLNPARGDQSPKAADLWGDRTKDVATGMLVKFEKGFSSPPHIHNITYRGVVIEGAMHNDDPGAVHMWLPAGSFWIQPAGENHITAAAGEKNMIYLEIDSGPYLVQPSEDAFDNGERPINIDARNLVWLDAKDAEWVSHGPAKMAYLWGETKGPNGSFVKLPAKFNGSIEGNADLKAVVVKGKARYHWNNERMTTQLSPSSFFESSVKGKHNLQTEEEVVIYVNSNGPFTVK